MKLAPRWHILCLIAIICMVAGIPHFAPLLLPDSAEFPAPPLLTTLPTYNEPTQSIYYVDCQTGADQAPGKDPSRAWRSLDKANGARLLPGDKLLLRRNCVWEGSLRAAWHGTENARILIGAYGEGERPRIQNNSADIADHHHSNVEITGSYQIIEELETTIVNAPVEPRCEDAPIGFFVGFNFRSRGGKQNAGSHNLLRYVKATHHTAGVHFNSDTHHNQVLHSEFTHNRVMHKLTPIREKMGDDIGAWGILLKGSNHEIAHNYLADNRTWCTFDTPDTPHGNAIEIYEGRDNVIHHNTSINDRVFSELGGSAEIKSDNNQFVYNLVVSSVPYARFIVSRGAKNQFGPTSRTKLYHNTVVLTGAMSEGIICGAGCGEDIVVAYNNIVWAEEKAVFADAPFREGYNLYWGGNRPNFQLNNFELSRSSQIGNPRFVDPEQGNYALRPNSPAIDAGVDFNWENDIQGRSVPQGSHHDLGAIEFGVGWEIGGDSAE